MPDDYRALYDGFRWQVPEFFNLAQACCRRWSLETSRIALHCEGEDGTRSIHTYAGLQADANRLSNALRSLGVKGGERVAILAPQTAPTVVSHVAIYQMGAVAVPLSMLFGADALEYRLHDSGAAVAIVDASLVPLVAGLRARLPALRHVIGIDVGGNGAHGWSELLARASPRFEPVDTRADEPALLIYTSGTTGLPKGALLPHRALIGNLPGFVASQNWFPQKNDVFWSPADWAWTGGLMDALLPTLYFGFPLVGCRRRFTPELARDLVDRYRVTNTFLFPTALKQMMRSAAWADARTSLRAIMSAGEPVGAAVFDWVRGHLGVTVNEMFGQTEMNYIVGNSAGRWPARAGAMGRAYPGHRVAVIDEQGRELAAGEVGEVALHRFDCHGHPDPVLFLGYWNQKAATEGKFSGDWCRTGDLARCDADGYFWYEGRADDVFKSSGYRIGPAEIENCLIGHPAVVNAAVVPRPDASRGNVVKAFVVLAAGHSGSDELVRQLQAHVRARLAPYEYPKDIEFIAELPMTPTGKVQRRVLRERELERAAQRRS